VFHYIFTACIVLSVSFAVLQTVVCIVAIRKHGTTEAIPKSYRLLIGVVGAILGTALLVTMLVYIFRMPATHYD